MKGKTVRPGATAKVVGPGRDSRMSAPSNIGNKPWSGVVANPMPGYASGKTPTAPGQWEGTN